MDEKNMQFANFNITFGQGDEPMLNHFEDVIFPALTSGYTRGKEGDIPRYSFADVRIKEVDDEYILVGNYIKSTEYKVVTTVQGGSLVSSPADVPTAPYSRFIVFLKNHRMVLIRNETSSPDIRSFQKTVREILNKYIRMENRERGENDKLPFAIVHIVDIPLKDSIEDVLKNVNKVNWLRLRFFPLNNDLDPLPLASYVRGDMQKVGSKTSNVTFNSPVSKNGITKVIEETGGMAVASMQVTDAEGEKRKIKEGTFSSSTKIEYNGNVNSNGDVYLVGQAKKAGVISKTSPENESLYNKVKNAIKELMKRTQ